MLKRVLVRGLSRFGLLQMSPLKIVNVHEVSLCEVIGSHTGLGPHRDIIKSIKVEIGNLYTVIRANLRLY